MRVFALCFGLALFYTPLVYGVFLLVVYEPVIAGVLAWAGVSVGLMMWGAGDRT
jgi:hypothetical protein